MSFTRWASTRTSTSQALEQAIEQFRADVDHEYRNYGIAYFPHLHTSLVRANDLDYTWFGAGWACVSVNSASPGALWGSFFLGELVYALM